MHFYDLDSEFKFGKYEGRTLEEVARLDPAYLNECAIEKNDFFITTAVIHDLVAVNLSLEFSEVALEKLSDKHAEWKKALDIVEDDEEEAYAYFDEQAWKDEFGLPDDDDEAEEILSLEAASLEAEVTGKFPGTPENDAAQKQIPDNSIDHDDAIEDFPFERLEEQEDDWDGSYDEEDEWN